MGFFKFRDRLYIAAGSSTFTYVRPSSSKLFKSFKAESFSGEIAMFDGDIRNTYYAGLNVHCCWSTQYLI